MLVGYIVPEFEIENDRPIIEVSIERGKIRDGESIKRLSFKALIDTGAVETIITEKIVKSLDL